MSATRPGTLVVIRRVLPTALAVALLLWLAVVTVRGTVLALQFAGIPIAGETQRHFATPPVIGAAVLVYLVCFIAALTARRVRPTATLPVACAAGGVVVLAGAVGSGGVGPLFLVLALGALAWLVGDVVLRRLPATADVPVVRGPIAVAFGLGLLGLLFFALATLERLNATTVLGSTGAILAIVLARDGERFRQDLARVSSWRPPPPTWFETVVIGLAVGLVSFALLAALVPETASDAVRQHLPIAREIWQTGSVSEFAPLGVSKSPIQGHVLYAVAYGFGGMTAAKLVQALVGVVAVCGVAGIGWLCAGRLAATVGAAVFATMPLVLWELGIAYADLFPVMFTVAAVLGVLLWQRDGMVGWLLGAGALAGFGFASKLTMGWMLVALAVALFLVGRAPWRWRDRILATMVFGLGAIVVVPWFIRSYGITGSVPGWSILVAVISRMWPGWDAPVDQIEGFSEPGDLTDPTLADSSAGDLSAPGLDRSPLDLVTLPWQMTFHGDEHLYSFGGGDAGVLLLLLLPLALCGPRTRSMAFLVVTTFVSYIGWSLTPFQILRHLLPTLAIAAALAGAGVASIVADATSPMRRALAAAAQAGVVVGLIAVPVLFLSSAKFALPVDLLIGREPAAAYVAREVPAAAALATASALLPPDTRIGYVGKMEAAQIYTETRLVPLAVDALGTTPEEVLAGLDRLGIDHFIWNRARTDPADWQATLLSTPFLLDHTRILAGDRDAYLFEVLPDDNPLSDARGQDQNLLADPGLESVGGRGPWTAEGRVNATGGVVSTRPEGRIAQRVSVVGGRPYLLVASGKCDDPGDSATLVLRWFDEDGNNVDTAAESVMPGIAGSEQFLWRRAPEDATSVSAEVVGAGGGARCEFDEVGLYALS